MLHGSIWTRACEHNTRENVCLINLIFHLQRTYFGFVECLDKWNGVEEKNMAARIFQEPRQPKLLHRQHSEDLGFRSEELRKKYGECRLT